MFKKYRVYRLYRKHIELLINRKMNEPIAIRKLTKDEVQKLLEERNKKEIKKVQ